MKDRHVVEYIRIPDLRLAIASRARPASMLLAVIAAAISTADSAGDDRKPPSPWGFRRGRGVELRLLGVDLASRAHGVDSCPCYGFFSTVRLATRQFTRTDFSKSTLHCGGDESQILGVGATLPLQCQQHRGALSADAESTALLTAQYSFDVSAGPSAQPPAGLTNCVAVRLPVASDCARAKSSFMRVLAVSSASARRCRGPLVGDLLPGFIRPPAPGGTPRHSSTPPRRHTPLTAAARRLSQPFGEYCARAARLRRTSVRSNRSANVRRRESHSGHSHPMNSAAVSSRCANVASQQPPDAGRRTVAPSHDPDTRTTARPRLQPVMAGSSHPIGQNQHGRIRPPRRPCRPSQSQPRCGGRERESQAASTRRGRRYPAEHPKHSAPARAGHDASGRARTTDRRLRRLRGCVEHCCHEVTCSSLVDPDTGCPASVVICHPEPVSSIPGR